MPDQPPKSRPEAPPDPADPPVYGGQWGGGGKADEAKKGKPDRPKPIDTPRESTGTGAPDGPLPI
jgi:hypothetical protein